jgi:formate hydrogenlyase subunit 6/NADH:ubiquinone oxidoreductase subunit I
VSEETFEGIPRSKIPWNPRIDYEKCVTCGKCVDFCHMKAFKLEEKDGKQRTVVNQSSCVVFCRGCEDICPTSAISHPLEEETKKIIEKIKNNT